MRAYFIILTKYRQHVAVGSGLSASLLGLLFILFGTSACNPCALGGGGGPDYDPVSAEYVVHLVHANASPLSEVIVDNYLVAGDLHRAVANFVPSSDDYVSFDETGDRFYLNSYLFKTDPEFRGNNRVTNPGDSLFSCTFLPDSPRSVCGLHREGSIPNPFANTSTNLAVARSGLLVWHSPLAAPTFVLQDTAQFISEDQYVVRTFFNPVVAKDVNRFAMIQRTETRQLMRDAAGQVVNDFVFSSQNDLVLWDRDVSDEPTVIAEHIPHNVGTSRVLAISPDGDRIAYHDNRGDVLVWDTATSAFTTVMKGRHPQFSASGDYLITHSRLNKISVYDFSSGSLREISALDGATAITADWDSDTLYLIRNNTLEAYSLTSGELSVLLTPQQFSDQAAVLTRNNNSTERIVNFGTMHFAGARSSNRLVLVLDATIYSSNYYDDGC